MPELTSTTPTDEELRAYFVQHIHESTPLELDSTILTPFQQQIGFADFVVMLAESIYTCLRRLNQLPRSDPFWENTNRKPTFYKLTGFCRKVLLKQDPFDTYALLATIALYLDSGSLQLCEQEWKNLRHSRDFQGNWLVYAAYELNCCTGMDPSSELVCLAKELQIEDAATALLETMSRGPGLFMRRFALKAIKECALSRNK